MQRGMARYVRTRKELLLMPTAKVAVVKTRPDTVLEDYSRLMHLADYQAHLPKENDTLIKLNLSWSKYYPACSSEPWHVAGAIPTPIDAGYLPDHPPPTGDTTRV